MFRKTVILYLAAVAVYILYIGLTWDRDLLADMTVWEEVHWGDSAKSVITEISRESGEVAFTLTLTGEVYDHFAGMGLRFPAERRDLSRFDEVTIQVESSAHYGTLLTAHQTPDGDTLITETTLRPETGRLTLSLADLEVPEWWKKLNPAFQEKEEHLSFKNCWGVIFGSSKAYDDHRPVPAVYRLTELRFHRNISRAMERVLLLLTPLVAALLLYGLRKRMRVVQFTSDSANCTKLETYIGESFSRQELTEELVSRELNLPPGALHQFCRKRLHCGFSGYLRIIRIAEAERLLTETPVQIKEIAGKVGYKHVSGFNRDFRKITGVTPGSFRK